MVEELFLQCVGRGIHVVTVELGYNEGCRFSLNEETVVALGGVVATELKYFAVHQFDCDRVVAQGSQIGKVAASKTVAMGTEYHLLGRWYRVER